MSRAVLWALVVVLASSSGVFCDGPRGPRSRPWAERDTQRVRQQKVASDHNLQQLMIALHEYNNAHGHFPSAVVLGPDGKTPHSWRVEILPFVLGGFSEEAGRPEHPYQKLYERYQLNEAWDGPHNKQVLKQIPDIFRGPGDRPDATDTVYSAVVGKGAIFDGAAGTPVADINDGSSRTILLVESKPAVPWTKPVDIAYDPAQRLPKFGGVYAGGFFAVDAAGGRHFIPADIKTDHLRALITRDGKDYEYDFPKMVR